jgi:hypothetical protein
MRRIKDVIKDTSVPSWLNSVPYNYGDAAAGVMKADEWRNLSTIFLPLALISMWGEGTSHPSPEDAVKFHQILDHTMLLVSAILLVCMRTMTEARSAAYLNYMAQYIRELTTIHPGIDYRPGHHMSMHLPHFLRLFGPVRSWWCFPFERLIGQIQRLLSNHKFGELFCVLECRRIISDRYTRANGVHIAGVLPQGGETQALVSKTGLPECDKRMQATF